MKIIEKVYIMILFFTFVACVPMAATLPAIPWAPIWCSCLFLVIGIGLAYILFVKIK